MGISGTAWLVCNAASGSNDDEAVAQVERGLVRAGLDLARVIRFPDEPAPDREELAAGKVDVLAVFAGDGTVHAVVTGAFGWDGGVLVLPGGTMNILAKKLHGDVAADDVLARLGAGSPRRVRPRIVHTGHGKALTGVLAGPGAIWNEVREAIREPNLLEVVATTKDAIIHSTSAPKVICAGVDCGREGGYAAITVTPHESGLEVKGYYAETLGDFAGQGIALLNRNYRNGPHDRLGVHDAVSLVCPEGEPMGLLIDGEPFDGGIDERLSTATCAVDLLATADAR
jgi:hypothetical protein